MTEVSRSTSLLLELAGLIVPIHPAPIAHSSAQSSLADICTLLGIANVDMDSDVQFQRRRVIPGRWVFGSGQKFDSVYIVLSGFLKTLLLDEEGNEQILSFALKGDLLGIDGLHSGVYPSQAVALTDSELIVIPFSDLTKLAHQHSAIETWLYRAISREMALEHTVVGILGTLGAEVRVARFLVSLSTRFEVLGYSPTQFNLNMTRQEIGSYLGLTLETVSRALSALNDAGLIRINQRAVTLKNIEALRALKKLSTGTKLFRGDLCKTNRSKSAKKNHSIWSSLAIAN
jgi:CRP/FNR family transcriptional regulator, anaerobic regulatory protein